MLRIRIEIYLECIFCADNNSATGCGAGELATGNINLGEVGAQLAVRPEKQQKNRIAHAEVFLKFRITQNFADNL